MVGHRGPLRDPAAVERGAAPGAGMSPGTRAPENLRPGLPGTACPLVALAGPRPSSAPWQVALGVVRGRGGPLPTPAHSRGSSASLQPAESLSSVTTELRPGGQLTQELPGGECAPRAGSRPQPPPDHGPMCVPGKFQELGRLPAALVSWAIPSPPDRPRAEDGKLVPAGLCVLRAARTQQPHPVPSRGLPAGPWPGWSTETPLLPEACAEGAAAQGAGRVRGAVS